jgi:hypothetical protein
VFGEALLPLPPHAWIARPTQATRNAPHKRRKKRFPRLRGERKIPRVPARASPPAEIHEGKKDEGAAPAGLSAATAVCVVMVKLVETGLPPDKVAFAGEKEHAAWAGSPVHEKFSVPANPAVGVTLRAKEAGCPDMMVALVGDAETVKPGAAITTVTGLDVLGTLFASPW